MTKKRGMLICFKEVSLEEGYELSKLPRHERIVAGREVSTASGIALFESLRGKPIRCWRCGVTADRWVSGIGSGQPNHMPVLNLFAPSRLGGLIMMTRDHIIPKMLGGVDALENLRPGCELCNSRRGANMTKADLAFMQTHPHLIDEARRLRGERNMKKQQALAKSTQYVNAVLKSDGTLPSKTLIAAHDTGTHAPPGDHPSN